MATAPPTAGTLFPAAQSSLAPKAPEETTTTPAASLPLTSTLQAQQTPTSTSATTNPLAAMSPSSSMFAPTPTTSTTTYNASNWSTNPSLYTGGVPNQSYYTALSANTGVQLNPAAATAPSATSTNTALPTQTSATPTTTTETAPTAAIPGGVTGQLTVGQLAALNAQAAAQPTATPATPTPAPLPVAPSLQVSQQGATTSYTPPPGYVLQAKPGEPLALVNSATGQVVDTNPYTTAGINSGQLMTMTINGQNYVVPTGGINGTISTDPTTGNLIITPSAPTQPGVPSVQAITKPTLIQAPSTYEGNIGVPQQALESWASQYGISSKGLYPGEYYLMLPQGFPDPNTGTLTVPQAQQYALALMEYAQNVPTSGQGVPPTPQNANQDYYLAQAERKMPSWYETLWTDSSQLNPTSPTSEYYLNRISEVTGITPNSFTLPVASSLQPSMLAPGASFASVLGTRGYTFDQTSTTPLLQTQKTPLPVSSPLLSAMNNIGGNIYNYGSQFGSAISTDISQGIAALTATIQKENVPIDVQTQAQIANFFPMVRKGNTSTPNTNPSLNDYMNLAMTNPLALADIAIISTSAVGEKTANAVGAAVNASPLGYITNPIRDYIAPYMNSSDPMVRAEGVAIGTAASFGIAIPIAVASVYGATTFGAESIGEILQWIAGQSVKNAAFMGGLNVAGGALLAGQTSPQQIASNLISGTEFGATYGPAFAGVSAAAAEILPGISAGIAKLLGITQEDLIASYPFMQKVDTGLLNTALSLGFNNGASLLMSGTLASLPSDVFAASLGLSTTLAPKVGYESGLQEPYNYKGLAVGDRPILGVIKTFDENGNPITKPVLGIPNLAGELATPRLDENGNPISPFPATSSLKAAETATGESANLRLTPVERQIFTKSIANLPADMEVEQAYVQSGSAVGKGLDTAKLPKPSDFNLEIKDLTPEENKFLTDLTKQYADDLVKVQGSSSFHSQAPEFRIGADLDPIFKTDDALKNYIQDAKDGLNKISGSDKFKLDPNSDGARLDKPGGAHLIDGHTEEEASESITGRVAPKRTPLGLKQTNPVNIKGVPTEAGSQTMKNKLGSSTSVRTIDTAEAMKSPEGWREYLNNYIKEGERKTTFAPGTWRIKDVIDSYTTAKILNSYNLNPVSRVLVDSNLDIWKTASKIKFGLTDADFATGQADITPLIKGIDPAQTLNTNAGYLFQAVAPAISTPTPALTTAIPATPAPLPLASPLQAAQTTAPFIYDPQAIATLGMPASNLAGTAYTEPAEISQYPRYVYDSQSQSFKFMPGSMLPSQSPLMSSMSAGPMSMSAGMTSPVSSLPSQSSLISAMTYPYASPSDISYPVPSTVSSAVPFSPYPSSYGYMSPEYPSQSSYFYPVTPYVKKPAAGVGASLGGAKPPGNLPLRSPLASYAEQYAPSLATVLFPQIEQAAEQAYNPIFKGLEVRPFKPPARSRG